MCGIAGIILKKRTSDIHLPFALEKMNKILAHRGPDDEGFILFKGDSFQAAGGDSTPIEVFNDPSFPFLPQSHIREFKEDYTFGFSHRRLSILDLSPAGHQPMMDITGRTTITFNGEIYNYVELREELKSFGYEFKTESDTEVVLNSYLKWGRDCVSRFNGMWAFVIYDNLTQEFFGSRDRMGVKPFYYYSDEAVFAFASEQKALVRIPFVKTEINASAAFDYFVLDRIEYEEEGMFKNVFELPPAHSFTYNLHSKEFNKFRYFSISLNNSFVDFSEEREVYYSEKLSELLQNAVKLRLRSDVPVGTCLSGGIDSSAITGIIQSLNPNNPLNTFTASFEDKNIDESSWAKMVADRPNTHWHQTFPNAGELLEDLENLTICQDIPIWSTSTYAQFRVMKLASEKGIKVVMSGQGGDELFGGYHDYLFPYLVELFHKGKLGLLNQELQQSDIPSTYIHFLKQLSKRVLISNFSGDIRLNLHKEIHPELNFLNQDFLKHHSHRFELTEEEQSSSLNEALSKDLNNRLLKKYLKCEDRCSMFHSVESRIPFADDLPLQEFAMQIPSAFKIRNGYQKYILRKAVLKYVPAKLAFRKDKMGYVTPNSSWIKHILPSVMDKFSNPDLKPFMDIDKIQKQPELLFNDQKSGGNSKVFKFISFALWLKTFEETKGKY
jgi:asparagine synthase (glutamine-hydrolysing)